MNRFMQLLVSDKVLTNMKKLYPEWEISKRINTYYMSKLKYSMYIIIIGIFVAVAIYINANKQSIISDGLIQRNTYMMGDKNITLKYKSDVIEDGDISFNVSERKYTDEELNDMYPEFEDELIKKIIGKNESADYVTSDLCFTKTLSGYPFKIKYKTDKPSILTSDGIIKQDNLHNYPNAQNNIGVKVKITSNISYENFEQELVFYVCIYENKLSDSELFIKTLNESLAVENDYTKESEYYVLPKTINGQRISFYEPKDMTAIYLGFASLIVAILIYFLKDQELEKAVKHREDEFRYEYPRLINKFTLFYNAGMPVKAIWVKICKEYLDEKKHHADRKYLYEEMLFTLKNIENGMREVDAYDDFAKRINLNEYSVFINLIIQAVQLGKKDLVEKMKTECENAFIERKNNAKRLLEEAGTKMLVPMFMMLAVVFIIILFPAFSSFKLYD